MGHVNITRRLESQEKKVREINEETEKLNRL